MKCSNCNNEISDTAKFCKHCGVRLNYSEETVKLEDDDLEIIKGEIVTGESQFQPYKQNTTETMNKTNKNTSESQPKKKKMGILIFVIIILTLVVFKDQIRGYLIKKIEEMFELRACCAFPPDYYNRANNFKIDTIRSKDITNYLDGDVDVDDYIDILDKLPIYNCQLTRVQKSNSLAIYCNDIFIQKRG